MHAPNPNPKLELDPVSEDNCARFLVDFKPEECTACKENSRLQPEISSINKNYFEDWSL
jgi:hypothetical protein